MGSEAPVPGAGEGFSALGFTAAGPRKDAILVLGRDSTSSLGSSHFNAAISAYGSPKPKANNRLLYGQQQADGLSESPPPTPVPGHLLHPVDEEPDTPSSTIVEFGDLGRGNVPSAAQLVERVHWSFRQSQSATVPETRSSSKARGSQDSYEGREGRSRKDQRGRSISTPSMPGERSQSAQRRQISGRDASVNVESERDLADERINLYLRSMAQQAAEQAARETENELIQENKSLYQRIAALQRTERELLAENQDLRRKLGAMKLQQERRARQWSENIRRKEVEYETRMRELGEQLLDLVSKNPQRLPEILSNNEISTWFANQDAAWNKWATAFGHQDPRRLGSLHPVHMQELCGEVRGFVRMTDTGGLPPEILDGGKEALQTLLNGMLAHFICSEIIASPMWVFAAASVGTLESPGIGPAKPTPGFPGFRLDKTSFADVAPRRPGRIETPRSPQFPPPLVTSMIPSLGNSESCLGLPLKHDMERLVYMLTETQRDDARVTAHHWRAQMMRLFADGGFGIKDVASAGNNEIRRTFVESRLNYARKLKERFLGSSARFLLQDQDPHGIERLENKLSELVDDALRFSCRLWTRMAPVRLYGWKDMGSKEVKASTSLVTLCHAQVRVEAHRHRAQAAGKEKPPQDDQTDQPMVMAVQPAVLAEDIGLPINRDGEDGMALVWLKARVMLAGPMSVDDAELEVVSATPSKSSYPPAAEDAAGKSAAGPGSSPQPNEVLPATSFKPQSRKATD